MKTWLILLCGLVLWAVHFFVAYFIGEFIGETQGPRIAVLGLTLLCLAGVAALGVLLRSMRPEDDHDRWRRSAALGTLAISFVAIFWQGFPALFVP
ncbi:MAG: hypothetical protein KKD64_03680 [Alphaproteobacteria bacterium]|nr:hypothetical protein [Alphaproteobacteria bacterium]MBU0794829.1 hypothetical protein [Alphaproteobacteria bacterium]MBU0876214.1 hypothetical protein [Alphaproteobacteria bacterium]MBU1768735.1 hypothetical protein [Alphaproteobacteria bacterium]